jgi:hypothetical protein
MTPSRLFETKSFSHSSLFSLHFGYGRFQLNMETADLYWNLKETICLIQQESFDYG